MPFSAFLEQLLTALSASIIFIALSIAAGFIINVISKGFAKAHPKIPCAKYIERPRVRRVISILLPVILVAFVVIYHWPSSGYDEAYQGNYENWSYNEPYQLIPFGRYDEILSIAGDYIVVRNDGQYALVTNSGHEQIPFGTYDTIIRETDGIMMVRQNSQSGAITISGSEAIPFGMFDSIIASDNNMFIVRNPEGFALIDRRLDYREVIPFGMFERIWNISSNYVLVGPFDAISLDGLSGRSIIEIRTLREVISPDMHEEIVGMRDGLIFVRSGGKYSVVDMNNDEVISFGENIRIVSIAHNLTAIESDGQYAIVDANGDEIIPFGMFERISSVAHGRAIVYRNGQPGVVQLNTLDGLFYSESGRFSARFVQEGDRRELAWYQGDTLFRGDFRENRDGTFGLTIFNFDELPWPVAAKRDGSDLIVTAGNPNWGEFFEERFNYVPAELNRGFGNRIIAPWSPVYYGDGIWISDGILLEELVPGFNSHLISLRAVGAIAGFDWSRESDGREILRDSIGNIVEFWPNESHARVNGEPVDITLKSGELATTMHDGNHHLFVLAIFFNEPIMRPFGIGVDWDELAGTGLWATVFAR